MSGKDDLSKVIRSVRDNLQDVGKAGDRIDDIKRKFKSIVEGTAPAKRQLRDIQKLLGEMNLNGLNKTEVLRTN